MNHGEEALTADSNAPSKDTNEGSDQEDATLEPNVISLKEWRLRDLSDFVEDGLLLCDRPTLFEFSDHPFTNERVLIIGPSDMPWNEDIACMLSDEVFCIPGGDFAGVCFHWNGNQFLVYLDFGREDLQLAPDSPTKTMMMAQYDTWISQDEYKQLLEQANRDEEAFDDEATVGRPHSTRTTDSSPTG